MPTRSTFHYWADWARGEANKFRQYAACAPQSDTTRVTSLREFADTCDSWAAEYAARAKLEDIRFNVAN